MLQGSIKGKGQRIKRETIVNIISGVVSRYQQTKVEEYSLEEYLDICKKDPLAYATAAERLLAAISKPKIIETKKKNTA